ncbi:MerR family transcriptional regulator [Methanoplanus endosymbiosus]|uniref:GyrI-like domain-containing protein n=1 Tax=Methanoplanus endosymbiosus TaxID=33865 RepID=A0A9E7PSR1_9EURY|nr:GyrI-like domain-containing protein [Methanoplanus endosymbiosus]UUX93082.1 GyrI-like domain-containing protein [Methanoplanus endosymbiosus]
MPSDRITISRFSLFTYLSQKALRLYDKKGILVPEEKDRFTGYRYYTTSQIEKALKIKTLSNLGFSLSDISDLLQALDDNDDESVRKIITKYHSKTMKEIKRLEKIESILKENKEFMELFKMNVSEPVIKDVPAMRVISCRRIGSYEEVCSEVSENLIKIIFNPANQKEGVKITGPFITICYDGEYRETDADIEMAVPVQGQIAIDEDGYQIRNLRPCRVISVIYKGPYEHEGFSAAYNAAFKIATEKGLETIGPERQIYLNNPDETTPEELLTEIQIPVKK